jgi:glycerophosphoryl diester phosphodiesterase
MLRFCLVLSLTWLATACGQRIQPNSNMSVTFDWQGHRGARGLLPENSIPSFLKALEYPILTLELDVVISRDSQVILSHEPWMSADICSKPDGSPVSKDEEQSLNLFQLTAAEIRSYDCGNRGNSRFPQQQAMTVHKPSLNEVVKAVRQYCQEHNRAEPFYNIEIKSRPEWDNIFTPDPATFATLVVTEVQRLKLGERACIQSFDVRALQSVHRIDPTLTLAYLIENTDGLEQNLQKLGFIPQIYSPYHKLVDATLVTQTHAQQMRLIPWTVNDTSDMRTLMKLGVDGIITDYPDYILLMQQ